jgi:hypothetical protein
MMSHPMPLLISSSLPVTFLHDEKRGHTENDSLGLLYSLSESTHGHVSHPSVKLLGSVEEIHQKRSPDWATYD